MQSDRQQQEPAEAIQELHMQPSERRRSPASSAREDVNWMVYVVTVSTFAKPRSPLNTSVSGMG
jgi:hypothetical protein